MEVKCQQQSEKRLIKSLYLSTIEFVAGPLADRSVVISVLPSLDPPLSPAIARKILSALISGRSPLLDDKLLQILVKYSLSKDIVLKLSSVFLVDDHFLSQNIPLFDLHQLLVLDLSKCNKVTSLKPISQHLGQSLKYLSVDHCKNLEDKGCETIGSLNQLISLKIGGTKISDKTLRLIGRDLTHLKILDIRCNLHFSEGLKYLTNLPLEKLNITECKFSVESTQCLKEFAETLEWLAIAFVPHLDDDATGFLEHLTKLKHLDISLTHSFGDLTIIRAASLPFLKTLIASKIDVPSVSAIEALGKNPSLHYLDLGMTDLNDICASKLNTLSTLSVLYIPYTRITDDFFLLAPELLANLELLKLTGIRELSNSGVARLAQVAKRVRELDIGSSNLTDPCLDHFATMSLLKILRIWNTAIKESAVAKFNSENNFIIDSSMRTTKGTYVLFREKEGNKRLNKLSESF